MKVTHRIIHLAACPSEIAARTRPGLQGLHCDMGTGGEPAHHVDIGRRQRLSQRGQASIEYLLIGLALCLVLFHGEPSAMKKILVAIQQNYSHFSYAMSLP
ncbi:hypothetical protein V8H18_09015 [Lautropia mirabilis]|jgi:hypothetical protein